MHIDFFKLYDYQLDLHEGVNILFEKNGYEFDFLGIFLNYIANNIAPKSLNSSFTDAYFWDFIEDNYLKILNENDNYDFLLKFDHYGVNFNKMKKCGYQEIANKIPNQIFSYFKRGTGLDTCSVKEYTDYKSFLQNKSNFYSDCFGRVRFSNDQLFWGNLFIANDINKTKYTDLHCSELTKIINEIIAINGYENFSFSYMYNCFVCYNGGFPTQISIRDYDIGVQIGMIMHLYRLFLQNHQDGFLGNVSQQNGVCVSNLDFGQRPSYSDKKWKYYDVFYKYFKNVQFIML